MCASAQPLQCVRVRARGLRHPPASVQPSAPAEATLKEILDGHGSKVLRRMIGEIAGHFGIEADELIQVGPGPIPVQMWEGRARSWCRCGRGGPGPGADVGRAGPVPVQMRHGVSPVVVQAAPAAVVDMPLGELAALVSSRGMARESADPLAAVQRLVAAELDSTQAPKLVPVHRTRFEVRARRARRRSAASEP